MIDQIDHTCAAAAGGCTGGAVGSLAEPVIRDKSGRGIAVCAGMQVWHGMRDRPGGRALVCHAVQVVRVPLAEDRPSATTTPRQIRAGPLNLSPDARRDDHSVLSQIPRIRFGTNWSLRDPPETPRSPPPSPVKPFSHASTTAHTGPPQPGAGRNSANRQAVRTVRSSAGTSAIEGGASVGSSAGTSAPGRGRRLEGRHG